MNTGNRSTVYLHGTVAALVAISLSVGCDPIQSTRDKVGVERPDLDSKVKEPPEAMSPVESDEGTKSAHASAPASVVVIDPDTGNIITPSQLPPGAAKHVADQENLSVSTSADGLVEEPVDAAPGGVKLDLQGRFQSAVKVKVMPGGKIVTECETSSTSLQE